MEPIQRGKYTNGQLAELLDEERAKNQTLSSCIDEMKRLVSAMVRGADLSRNHDGDLIMVQPGRPTEIVARVGTPLWIAIVGAITQSEVPAKRLERLVNCDHE